MRLIDADALTYSHTKDGDVVVYPEAIAEARTIEQPKWIPCSERMPDKDGHYLVTLDFDYGRSIEMGWLLGGEWVNENSHVTIAWRPLPEPYKGGK